MTTAHCLTSRSDKFVQTDETVYLLVGWISHSPLFNFYKMKIISFCFVRQEGVSAGRRGGCSGWLLLLAIYLCFCLLMLSLQFNCKISVSTTQSVVRGTKDRAKDKEGSIMSYSFHLSQETFHDLSMPNQHQSLRYMQLVSTSIYVTMSFLF